MDEKLVTLNLVQSITVRTCIEAAYEERIRNLNQVRARHVERLINTPNITAARAALFQRLIRDIDENVKNHSSMLTHVLASLAEVTTTEGDYNG